MSEEVFITSNSLETQKIAAEVADSLKPGNLIAFYGKLGSGKTTFIQGLAKALGIEKRIISPTFIIVRTYKLDKVNRKGLENFYHIDLYRTETKHDLLSVGLDQLIEEKNSIIAVEWAEKMRDLLPMERIEIHIKNLGDEKREIIVKKYE